MRTAAAKIASAGVSLVGFILLMLANGADSTVQVSRKLTPKIKQNINNMTDILSVY
jgi:hypothetical protein